MLRCLAHQRAFTLYPPGYVPYGRERVAWASPDGRPVHTEGDDGAYRGTTFDAALDGAIGEAWPRTCKDKGSDERRWTTQGRRIERSTRLVGVAPDLSDALRLALAEALGVEALLLHDGAAAIGLAPGYRSRGASVAAVLDRLVSGPVAAERLCVAGHLAGLWGRPRVWDAAARQLRTPLRGLDTPPPPGGT